MTSYTNSPFSISKTALSEQLNVMFSHLRAQNWTQV